MPSVKVISVYICGELLAEHARLVCSAPRQHVTHQTHTLSAPALFHREVWSICRLGPDCYSKCSDMHGAKGPAGSKLSAVALEAWADIMLKLPVSLVDQQQQVSGVLWLRLSHLHNLC